jgi:hypothetical protein
MDAVCSYGFRAHAQSLLLAETRRHEGVLVIFQEIFAAAQDGEFPILASLF